MLDISLRLRYNSNSFLSMTLADALQRIGASAADLNGLHEVVIGLDGQHVYAATDVTDMLHTFGRDLGTGAQTYHNTFTEGVDGVDGLEKV